MKIEYSEDDGITVTMSQSDGDIQVAVLDALKDRCILTFKNDFQPAQNYSITAGAAELQMDKLEDYIRLAHFMCLMEKKESEEENE